MKVSLQYLVINVFLLLKYIKIAFLATFHVFVTPVIAYLNIFISQFKHICKE